MRTFTTLLALAAVLTSMALGQRSMPSAETLEAFGKFANSPNAQEIWSKPIGHIETDRASATVTAIDVANPSDSGRQMRGIRIDLTEGSRADRLYSSEDMLERLITAMDEISRYVPSPTGEPQINHCSGSGLFWLQEGHAFSASECTYGDWHGLAVFPGDFRFTRTWADAFGNLFSAARAELRANDRLKR